MIFINSIYNNIMYILLFERAPAQLYSYPILYNKQMYVPADAKYVLYVPPLLIIFETFSRQMA